MPPLELLALFNDLALERLRLLRPTKFVFLCGGTISGTRDDRPESLRDYLFRIRNIQSRMSIVLAESANQLFRDTRYNDLITFEEDIARIASVVLVISESPGSLAELGAFASNDTIRPSLRVLVQSSYERAESFIRFGPIQRIMNDARANVGFYPWRTHKGGKIVAQSAKTIQRDIEGFIVNHVNATPASFSWEMRPELRLFALIYWIIYLSFSISSDLLHECIRALMPDAQEVDVENKIFCMRLAGWIEIRAHGPIDYYYTLHDRDVFEYAFRPEAIDHDSHRRKLAVSTGFRNAEPVPRLILEAANQARQRRLPR